MSELKVTQIKSTIGVKPKTREALRTLGLKRIRHSVVRPDDAQNRGLLQVVRHLVVVEPVEAESVSSDKSGKKEKK